MAQASSSVSPHARQKEKSSSISHTSAHGYAAQYATRAAWQYCNVNTQYQHTRHGRFPSRVTAATVRHAGGKGGARFHLSRLRVNNTITGNSTLAACSFYQALRRKTIKGSQRENK